MKFSLDRFRTSGQVEEQIGEENKVSTQFCLSCIKDESDTSSALKKTYMW